MRLIDGREIDPSQAPRLVDTYNLFVEQLRRTTAARSRQVVAGIEKLLIVDIALERDHDNPQLIFESLNSTGLDLSQADLIRNYVLMGLPPKEQAEIYTNVVVSRSSSRSRPSSQDLFDRFMRDYLTMKTGQIPKIDRVYESFKALAQASELSNADLVADVYHHSKHWVQLAFDRADDPALREAIARPQPAQGRRRLPVPDGRPRGPRARARSPTPSCSRSSGSSRATSSAGRSPASRPTS